MAFRQPPPLKPNDKVAIISPSSGLPYLFPWVYEQGLERLKQVFQIEPVEYPTARKSPDYLSKNPQARAEDINHAFSDPAIKGIIATICGNDQIRILPYLDEKILSSNPKIFMGYSDCTNLHLYLWNLNLISYYGGALMTQFAMGGGMHDYTVHSIRKAVFEPPIGQLEASPEYSDADLDWSDQQNLTKKRSSYPSSGWSWHNSFLGVIEGRLWGGCLEILSLHLSVKHYLPDPEKLNGTILYLETSEEMPSEGFIYRFVMALAELKMLEKFQAILMAYPKAQFCHQKPPEGREAYIINQQNAVKAALKDYNVHLPVIFNMNFGHTDPQMIIPNGGIARINGSMQTIEFL